MVQDVFPKRWSVPRRFFRDPVLESFLGLFEILLPFVDSKIEVLPMVARLELLDDEDEPAMFTMVHCSNSES